MVKKRGRPRAGQKEQSTVALAREVKLRIGAMANAEHRSFSQMAGMLLVSALRDRGEIDADGNVVDREGAA